MLREVMQKQRVGFGSKPNSLFDAPSDSSGNPLGLLGRLLALKANQGSKFAVGERAVPAEPIGTDVISPDEPPSRLGSNYQHYAMGITDYNRCVEQCLHLLPSPSGDLQSSEFRQCVGKCMGRL